MEEISTCPLCRSKESSLLFKGTDLLYRTTNNKFSIRQCRTCGLARLDPRPTEKERARYYPDQYGTFHTSVGRPIAKNLLFSLYKKLRVVSAREVTHESHSSDESRQVFLDFGCGNGALLEKLRTQHPRWDLYGIDIDDRACEVTSKKGFTVFCGDISQAPYKDNMFDAINASQVLEHTREPLHVLQTLARMLKIGGTLTVDVPNLGSLSAKLFRSRWYNLDIPRHLFHFTPHTLSLLVQKSGLAVVSIKTRTDSKTLLASLNFFMKGGLATKINPVSLNVLRPAAWFLNKINRADYIYLQATKPQL